MHSPQRSLPCASHLPAPSPLICSGSEHHRDQTLAWSFSPHVSVKWAQYLEEGPGQGVEHLVVQEADQ